MIKLTAKKPSSNDLKKIDSRIISLNKFLKENTAFNDDFLFSYERSFLELLNCLMNNKKAKLIFILKYVKVSSIWQLSNKYNLGYRENIKKDILTFEKYEVIKRLSKTDDDYELIHNVWANIYPNARRVKSKKPQLYMLTDKFEKTVEEFLPFIYKKYIWKSEFVKIEKNKMIYERAYNIEKPRFVSNKYIEDNKIGNCEICGKIIRNDKDVKTPFKKIGNKIVCIACKKDKKVTKEHIRKWTSETR